MHESLNGLHVFAKVDCQRAKFAVIHLSFDTHLFAIGRHMLQIRVARQEHDDIVSILASHSQNFRDSNR